MKKDLKYTIIKSLAQYTEYCDLHESLLFKGEAKHTDEIELLELIIEDYDQRMMKEKGRNSIQLNYYAHYFVMPI